MMPQAPFFVLSLPRSRSAWMSHYLSYDGARVGHDTLVECDNVAQFLSQFSESGLAGSCETGAMVGWRLLKQKLPEARICVVLRDVADVAVSLAKQGLLVDTRELEARAAMLEMLAEQPGVLVLEYDELSLPEVAGALFEFCLERPFDFGWWERMENINIQLDFGARVDRLRSRAPALAALKAEVISMTKGAPTCGLH